MTEATRLFSEGAGGGTGAGARDDEESKRKHAAFDDGPSGGGRTWYDVLEVAPDVGSADLKHAYDRSLALVEGRSIGGYLMLDPLAAESARAEVETAFFVLGDDARRRSYDDRVRADGGDDPPARQRAGDRSEAKEDARNAQAMVAERSATQPSSEPAASYVTSVHEPRKDKNPSWSGLKFTAPAEPNEDAGASVAPFFAGASVARPASGAGPDQLGAPGKRISIIGPAEDVVTSVFTNTPHDATATIPPEAHMPAPTPLPSLGGAAAASVVAPKAGLPDSGEIAGALIRELREARGLTLDDLADATKIRKPYLRAVEEEDVPNLPDRVYLRGFLTQVARVLKVDRARLAEGYLLTVERVGKDAPPAAT